VDDTLLHTHDSNLMLKKTFGPAVVQWLNNGRVFPTSKQTHVTRNRFFSTTARWTRLFYKRAILSGSGLQLPCMSIIMKSTWFRGHMWG